MARKINLAEEMQEASRLRLERASEAKIAAVEAKLKASEAKRRQAEADLHTYRERQSFIDQSEEHEAEVFKQRKSKPNGQATAVLVLTDWHAEETVDSTVVGGLNSYDLEICSRRVEAVSQNAVELIEHERRLSKIDSLVVALLGDFITGYIHEELVEGNSLSPTEAVRFVKSHIRGALEHVAKHTKLPIHVVTSFGNHGRTTQKKRIATSYSNSFEWLMYHDLAERYESDKRFSWQVGNGYFSWLDIQGKAVRFHHGDSLRYQGGIGGLCIPVLRAISQWNTARKADLDVFGHWHQFLPHPRFIACNCLIGYGPYSEFVKAEYSQPAQTLAVIDRKRPGAVTVKQIFCD